ncbi:MAG: hypothetical protein MJH10_10115 [Epibacterium sp.]|nr:hypothetical protein [Epibacterium sp.]NQX73892.1 hypothetical protein [Epibacterium sp.]
MRIAYTYDRPDADAPPADRHYADAGDRPVLDDMLTRRGVRPGDVVVVRALSDLGQGAASKRVQRILAGMDVAVEVAPMPDAKRGRKPRVERPGADVLAEIETVYRSAASVQRAVDFARKRTGQPVTRNNLWRWFGAATQTEKEGPSHG